MWCPVTRCVSASRYVSSCYVTTAALSRAASLKSVFARARVRESARGRAGQCLTVKTSSKLTKPESVKAMPIAYVRHKNQKVKVALGTIFALISEVRHMTKSSEERGAFWH